MADDAHRQGHRPVVRATIAHHGFEVVHPFEDGNGRAGRLVLNLMLKRDGFPPALVLREWHLGSIHALDAANTGDYRGLNTVIGRRAKRLWGRAGAARLPRSAHHPRP